MGFGRAIQHLRNHNSAPYEDVILETCLKVTTFDLQVDGTRASYLMQAIQLFENQSTFQQAILRKLTRIPYQSRVRSQLLEFAYYFAKEGSDDAKISLYAAFLESLEHSDYTDPDCTNEIIELDGIDGLVTVVEALGKQASQDPEYAPIYDWWERDQKSRNADYVNALEIRKALSAPIAAFLQSDTNYQEWRSKKLYRTTPELNPKKWSFDEMMLRLLQENRSSIQSAMRIWATHTTENNINELAIKIDMHWNTQILSDALSAFAVRAFPLNPSIIIELTKHSDSNVSWKSFRALRNITHISVRSFALQYKGESENQLPRAIGLLKHNYQTGDHWFIAQALSIEMNDDWQHQLGLDALSVTENNLTSEFQDVLQIIYKKGRCLHCRENVLELLEQLNLLPQSILEECVFDASLEIREWAKALLEAQALA